MSGKISLDAAMRARDVSRPTAADDSDAASHAESGTPGGFGRIVSPDRHSTGVRATGSPGRHPGSRGDDPAAETTRFPGLSPEGGT